MTFAKNINDWYDYSLKHPDTYGIADSLKWVSKLVRYYDSSIKGYIPFRILGALKIKPDAPTFHNKTLVYRLVMGYEYDLLFVNSPLITKELYTGYVNNESEIGIIHNFQVIKLEIVNE